MRINNPIANYSFRQLEKFNIFSNKSLEKLSAGHRINRAADDASGLAISEKFRTQVNGIAQAERNILDGISLIQTAESAYSEITDILQRIRTLAVQTSNDTLTNEDRKLVQLEVSQLLSEIDRYEENVEYNKIKLLKGTAETNDNELNLLRQYLNDNWIAAGQQMANTIYDMSGSEGGPLEVVLDAGAAGGTLAYVSTWTAGPSVVKQELHIELADFQPVTLPNGGANPTFYNDRIILHEMIHATHAWHSNGIYDFNTDVPTWFKEAAAEYSHGANDRVLYDGGMTAGGSAAIRTTDISNWGGTSIYYSSAYEAAMYMNRTYGGGAGDSDGDGSVLDQIFRQMELGNSFDDAIDYVDDGIVNGSLNETIFLNNYSNAAAYDAQIQADAAFFFNGGGFNGGTGGYWAIDGGAGPGGKTAEDTVDDLSGGGILGGYTLTFTNFSTSSAGLTGAINIQAGANKGEKVVISLNQINTQTLGINNLNLSTRESSESAINLIDKAVNLISSYRSELGAKQNRLEHIYGFETINRENLTAAESRIRDTDFAAEMIEYTKNNVMAQAAQETVSKANEIQYSSAVSAINGTEGIEASNNLNSEKLLNNTEKNSAALNGDMEKLSSGKRINYAADDAAGLAVSEKLLTQIKGLEQAEKNIQDGISLIQTTDGALEEVKSLLQRMNVLSVQSANDSLTNDDRALIQLEMNELLSEIDRITSSADFNGINLLRQATKTIQIAPTVTPSTITADTILYTVGEGVYDIWKMNSDGTNVSAITSNGISSYGVWSPDKTQIVFLYGASPNEQVAIMNADGTGIQQLTFGGGRKDHPKISADGNTIVYMAKEGVQWEIYSIDKNGTTPPIRLTNNALNDSNPCFSPDGSKIVFCSNQTGKYEIYIMNADGSGRTQLTFLNSNTIAPEYSPDGSIIVFSSDASGSEDIYIMNSDGSGQISITPHIGGYYNAKPTFSSDSTKIIFRSNRDGNSELYIMDIDGLNQTRLTNTAFGETCPSWSGGVPFTGSTSTTTTTATNTPVSIHAGANANQTIDIERKETTLATLNISNLNISTRTNAEESISKIQSAINQVNDYSSYFGSMQNRLEQTYNYTGISKENQSSSESRIRDIDFAEQFMKYTKNQILHNASVSMLAQANINRSFMMRFL